MASTEDGQTEELIRRAAGGEAAATEQLLARYRGRLRQMVAVRLDPRLAARLDPSDVVQEALVEITRRLPEYLRTRPLPIYPWLRQITWEQLMHLHVRHLAKKRTPLREDSSPVALSDGSVMQLAERVAAAGGSPSRQAIRKEVHQRVRRALERLGPHHREVLILRYLEQLSNQEIAAVLRIREGTARMRHLRALEKLRELLGREGKEVGP